jgi:hypothetical protein
MRCATRLGVRVVLDSDNGAVGLGRRVLVRVKEGVLARPPGDTRRVAGRGTLRLPLPLTPPSARGRLRSRRRPTREHLAVLRRA